MVSMLKRFSKSGIVKGLLSLCLALAMIFALLPTLSHSADALTGGDKVYLVPSANWKVDNARFAIYYFGAGETWVSMSDPDGDGIYEATMPDVNYTHMIFCRMTPSNTDNNWNNKWNQTEDLSIPKDGTNCYTVKEGTWNNGGGTWSSFGSSLPGGGDDNDDPGNTDTSAYYLFGYIDRANYGCDDDYATLGKYKFEDGKLTTSFVSDSYVGVKSGDNAKWYMTDGWLGSVKSATLYSTTSYPDIATPDKLFVPGGVEITFTLTVNDNNTVTLSYEADTLQLEDTSGIQDGTTLHAWNWSFNQIASNMELIAKMGFTAVQTSPVQPLKEPTNLSHHSIEGNWWVYYQPVDFVITTDSGNALGTKTELEAMIAVAHEYGIKVIVDVVANHLGNATGNDLAEAIPNYLRNENYWHDITVNTTDYTDRADITQHCMAGLPDLNTANKDVQNYVLDFLKECIDIGVDGFRFDAAKHIETPDDATGVASDFWPTVIGGARAYAEETRGIDLYCYGELLDEPGGMLPISAYTKYMSVTDNSWGNTLRGNIAAGTASINEGYNKVADPGQLVLWAESHDTFADGTSSGVTETQINRTWALVAARADVMGLYLARPNSVEYPIGNFATTNWTDAVVKAANQFHTHFVGQDEIVSTYGDLIYIERGTSGVVIVAPNAAEGQFVEVDVPVYAMEDGTYTDQIIGMDYTVSNGRLTGTIYINGVSVIYNKPACAHENTTTTSFEPTCEGWGQTYVQCDDCDAILSVQDLEPTGHDYTYVNNGENHTVTCKNGCGYSAVEDHSFVGGSCICGATDGTVDLNNPVFYRKTLSLQSYIAFNLTVKNSVLENYDSWYVVFERYDHIEGTIVTETVESVPYSTSYQLFEYKVSSYMMSDSITATLYAVRDGVTYKGEVYTDSVENFVVSRMASAADSSADLATLYANLLTYGAKAQTFLGYNAEALADAKLGEYASYVTTTVPTAENLYAETSNGLTGATKNKLALGISSAVQIQLRINLDAGYDVNTVYGELSYTRGTETITQRIDGKDFTKSGSRYVLIFDAITAVDGRAPVQITIYDQNGTAISETWTYSISSYLADGGLSGNGLATMEALLNYFDAAAKVFG